MFIFLVNNHTRSSYVNIYHVRSSYLQCFFFDPKHCDYYQNRIISFHIKISLKFCVWCFVFSSFTGELARALASMPGVYRVDLLATRQLAWSRFELREQTEILSSRNPDTGDMREYWCLHNSNFSVFYFPHLNRAHMKESSLRTRLTSQWWLR